MRRSPAGGTRGSEVNGKTTGTPRTWFQPSVSEGLRGLDQIWTTEGLEGLNFCRIWTRLELHSLPEDIHPFLTTAHLLWSHPQRPNISDQVLEDMAGLRRLPPSQTSVEQSTSGIWGNRRPASWSRPQSSQLSQVLWTRGRL